MTDAPMSDAERAILVQRTAALARREGAAAAVGEPAIFFRVGRQQCCAFARSVRAAIKLDEMVPIPHGNRAIAGAIISGGNVIPVFHLSALLNERIGQLPETAQALLLGDARDQAAVAVDAIDRFGEIEPASLGGPPADSSSTWVVGTTNTGETLIDLDALHAGPALWVEAGTKTMGQAR